MSQSPTGTKAETAGNYLESWRVLEEQILRGSSFSGREADCLFLNTGGGPFADASHAAGFSFRDDGRALGVVDWDLDGDVDLWARNRTTPGLRFLRNETPRDGRFLAVRLEGEGPNRDAIGARLDLELEGAGGAVLTRSLRAGENFRGQSTKWVHFGLGEAEGIRRLRVRWPDGSAQTLEGLQKGRLYVVRQGREARPWSPPSHELLLHPSPPRMEEGTQRYRLRPAGPLPAPHLDYRRWNGEAAAVDEAPGGALLVNFWATWCVPCAGELKELGERSAQLREAGLKVLALDVDGLGEEEGASPSEARAFLDRLGFPFPAGMASEVSLRKVETLVQTLLYSERPMGIPVSLLLSAEGDIVAVYRGRADLDEVLQDVARLDLSPEERQFVAPPFPGRWGVTPPTDLLAMADAFKAAGFTEERERYVRREVRRLQRNQAMSLVADAADRLELGNPLLARPYLEAALAKDPGLAAPRILLGRYYTARGRPDEAVGQLEAATAVEPHNAWARRALGEALLDQGRLAEAEEQVGRVLRALPEDREARYLLAGVRYRQGRIGAALEILRRLAREQPGWSRAPARLAFILATDPDKGVRDGERALELARHACTLSEEKDWEALDALAAAQAELGRYERAVATAQRALALRRDDADLEARLTEYRAHKPHREPPPAASP